MHETPAMLQHLVLTRFSYRGYDRSKGGVGRVTLDPLDPWTLDFRFRLFEIICLPNILAQTNQDFDWILIIDQGLPGHWKARLKELTGVRERTFCHEYRPGDKITGLKWLEPYMKGRPEYLLTTEVDDDDGLPRAYVASLRSHIGELAHGLAKESLPPFKVFGAMAANQWDLFFSRKNPHGTIAPWHRGLYPVSCGFSLLCRYPTYDYSVFKVPNRLGHVIFDDLTDLKEPWRALRQEFKARVKTSGERWEKWTKEDFFFDVSTLSGPVVMTNHFLNQRINRLYVEKPGHKSVSGPQSFPNMVINWDRVNESSWLFRKSYQAYRRTLLRLFITIRARHKHIPWLTRVNLIRKTFFHYTWKYIRM